MKNKNNIFVTGATGFIGSYLCEELLQRGYTVFGFSKSDQAQNIKSLLNHKEFYLEKGDVRDLNALCNIIKNNNIKAIFHLAAQLPHNQDFNNPFLCFDVNARGTLNLLNLAYRNGVGKFIYTSTMSVYSEPPNYLPVDEQHPTEPSTIYGVSKLEGEFYCKVYSKKMNITILRYGGVYGKGDLEHRATFKFIRQALNNAPITVYGDGSQTNDFVYIKDVIQGSLLALENNKPGIYNIGSGEEISLKELARKIINLTNSKSKIIQDNKKTNRPFRFVLDIQKARKILGYHPLSLDKGLHRYILEFNTMIRSKKQGNHL